MAESILKINSLVKNFRSHWTMSAIKALQGISFEVGTGEAFGFLGHNGAGKTTAIKCILGLVRKTSGEILFQGEPLMRASQRAHIGYLPEQPYFYDHLSVLETLDFFASLHGMRGQEKSRRVNELLALVGLQNRTHASVRSLSKGLQQRLGFAQAIINSPALLILDEPFSGLDPLGRVEIRKLIVDLHRNGTSIMMSSHILSDVENICSRVSIMTQGIIQETFSIKEMSAKYGKEFTLTILTERAACENQSLNLGEKDVSFENTTDGTFATYHFEDTKSAHQALQICVESKCNIQSFSSCSPKLEDIFIDITSKSRKEVA